MNVLRITICLLAGSGCTTAGDKKNESLDLADRSTVGKANFVDRDALVLQEYAKLGWNYSAKAEFVRGLGRDKDIGALYAIWRSRLPYHEFACSEIPKLLSVSEALRFCQSCEGQDGWEEAIIALGEGHSSQRERIVKYLITQVRSTDIYVRWGCYACCRSQEWDDLIPYAVTDNDWDRLIAFPNCPLLPFNRWLNSYIEGKEPYTIDEIWGPIKNERKNGPP